MQINNLCARCDKAELKQMSLLAGFCCGLPRIIRNEQVTKITLWYQGYSPLKHPIAFPHLIRWRLYGSSLLFPYWRSKRRKRFVSVTLRSSKNLYFEQRTRRKVAKPFKNSGCCGWYETPRFLCCISLEKKWKMLNNMLFFSGKSKMDKYPLATLWVTAALLYPLTKTQRRIL